MKRVRSVVSVGWRKRCGWEILGRGKMVDGIRGVGSARNRVVKTRFRIERISFNEIVKIEQ